MIDRYLKICTRVEREFARNRGLYGEQMRCGPGCSDCCHQLFQITEIEAAFGALVLPMPHVDRFSDDSDKHTSERQRTRAC